MKKIFLAATLIFSANAAPAFAADPATLGCIITSMPADLRKSLMDGGGKMAIQEATGLPQEANAAAATAALACQKKHSWSDEATKAALTYSIAQAAYAGVVSQADQMGIKEGPFLNALASLKEEQLKGILNQDSDSLNAFVKALIANGINVDEKGGVLLGVMAAFWVLSDANRTTFAGA